MSDAMSESFGPADNDALSRTPCCGWPWAAPGPRIWRRWAIRSIAISPRRWKKPSEEAAVTAVSLKDAQRLPAGSSLMFKFGWQPSLLIHHADGTWSAFSAVCTHLGCTVQYQPEQHRIYCACHGGVYDAVTGANISGPPPRPLRRYEVKLVADGGVIVSRV